MKILDNFYVCAGAIHLNKYAICLRTYKDVEKTEYKDRTIFCSEAMKKEYMEQLIPKHQLLELISIEELDNSQYSYMEGIKLKTKDTKREIEEIASYGSEEAYLASLPSANDEYLLDLDARLCLLELGITGGDL